MGRRSTPALALLFLSTQTESWAQLFPQLGSRTRSNQWTKPAKRSWDCSRSLSDTKRNWIARASSNSASSLRMWQNPNLVIRDRDGAIKTVRYEAVNAMLLNEFLKEHHKVERLEATVESLAATVKQQAAQI